MTEDEDTDGQIRREMCRVVRQMAREAISRAHPPKIRPVSVPPRGPTMQQVADSLAVELAFRNAVTQTVRQAVTAAVAPLVAQAQRTSQILN